VRPQSVQGLGYGLGNWGSRVQLLVGTGNFSLHDHV